MNIEDFYNQDDVRKYLRRPFNIDGRTIATNGAVLISMPTVEPDYDDLPEKIKNTVIKVLTNMKDMSFKPMPEIEFPEMIDCYSCSGTGKAIIEKCPECNGEGEATAGNDYSTYEVLCKSCDGQGVITSQGGSCDCPTCDGAGKTHSALARVDVDGVRINLQYLALIINEKNINIHASADLSMLYFKAGQNEGLIMGMSE